MADRRQGRSSASSALAVAAYSASQSPSPRHQRGYDRSV